MLKLLNQYPSDCTGCGACYNICPVNAIKMEPDKEGFLYPHISDKCISCGKCERVCPKIHPDKSNVEEPECYAARANDEIRAESSSGGMFTVLAEHIIDLGGVVFGAEMTADYSVHHVCVDRKEDLYRIRKSKYVQSSMGTVYGEIATYLKEGRKVLFVGCPCQVAAVKNYIGKNRENFFCVDILCHGVPSVKMLQDYMRERFAPGTVEGIDFRSKANGWRSDQLRILWKDGSAQQIPMWESEYEIGFQKSICLRDGCEDCEFCGHQRQGDLTIGDFWRINDYDPNLNDGKGTSAVLVNNEIGRKLLDCVRNELLDIQKTPLSAAARNRLKPVVKSHPSKERFKFLYPQHTFCESIRQCIDEKYDIGLVGIYACRNYGGQLTQYALYSTLTQLGYSVLMIERPEDSKIPAHRKGPYLFEENPYPKYARAPYYANISEMKLLNDKCRVFVTGSDQMFNNNLYNDCNKYMTLNFVMDNHRKIAYAASWGHDRIWGAEIDRASESYFLRKFDYFSVREDSAVALAEREFGVKATQVLDPVFLCPKENYLKLIERAKHDIPQEPYLFAYILDTNKEKESILRNYANEHHLIVRAMTDAKSNTETKWDIDTLFGVSLNSWLAHIVHSDFYITDSFHGACIAILFHKQFVVLVNKLRGETRFTSILRLLHLEDRMVYSEAEMKEKIGTIQPIAYDAVDKIIEREQKNSINWLLHAINDDKDRRKPLSEFDILDSRCDDITRKFDQKCDDLLRENHELRKELDKTASMRFIRIWRKSKRLVRGGMQCIKDNGVAYTINRIFRKLRNVIRNVDKD